MPVTGPGSTTVTQATQGTQAPGPSPKPGTSGLQQLATLSIDQIKQALAAGQLNINQLMGALGVTNAQTGAQAGAQTTGAGLQEQQLGISGANIGIQQAGVTAQGAENAAVQGTGPTKANPFGTGEVGQYNISQAQNTQQQAQNTAQFGYSTQLNTEQQQAINNTLAQNTAQYGYTQTSDTLQSQALSNTAQQNTDQYNLSAQQYGTNIGNLQYQTGQAQLAAQSNAVSSGALNTAGYSNTQANIAQQYGYNLSSLQNQFASTTSAYNYNQAQNQNQQAQLTNTEQSQASAYQYGQQQGQNELAQLNTQQQASASAYDFGQQQLKEQSTSAALGQKTETTQYQYTQGDLARQKATLSNLSKANGISEDEVKSQLTSGLAQLGLNSVMDTSGIMSEIIQASQGQISNVMSAVGGPLALTSGLGGLLSTPSVGGQ